jgi:uncharacterized membrane protein YqjE
MIRRLLGTRLSAIRQVAHDFVDGLDDRGRLFALELAAERRRLARLVVVVLVALVVGIIAVVWAAATVIAFAWDTPWRNAALLGLLAFWMILAVVMALAARRLLKGSHDPFRLSRQIVTEDVARLREVLR